MTAIVSVTAAILAMNGKVLIARRRRGASQGGKWEFPGGKVEAGESPQEALVRELKEELNIEVAVGECIGTHIHNYPDKIISLSAYRTKWIAGDLQASDHSRLEWAAPDQLHRFDFAPADLPFVEQVASGSIPLEYL